MYRLQSPRLEGRHLLWFKAWNSRSVLCRKTLAEVGNRRKAGVQVAVAKARGETLAVVQSLELPERAGSTRSTALRVLQPLGWRIAEAPNKCLPCSKVFNAAGSSFSLARAPQGNWEISNKEGRLPALRAMVNSVCNKGFEQPAVLVSLKGRFLYASTHTFGRVAHLAGRRHLEARQRRLHPTTANHRPPRGHTPARELRRHQRSSCGGQAPLCFGPYIWARC